MQQLSFWKRYRFFSAQHKMGWKGTVLLGFALLGTLLTMGGTFVYAQHMPWRMLAVNTTMLHASTDCSYVVTQGWTCPLTLSRSDSSTASLPWSAISTSGIPVTLTPATGTLLPGGTTTLSIAVANRACPSTSTVSFKGPNNTVKVRWSCSAAPLTLTPTQFIANSQCPATSGGWQCSAVVGEAAASQGNLNWSTKSYLSGATFTPASGVLSPGGSTPVSIFIPQGTTCKSGSFSFAGQGSNTITARWMCKAGPSKVTIDEFRLPNSSNNPYPTGITTGPDGNLWFTEFYGNSIGRITPSGSITLFPLPTPNSFPEHITAGPDGNLWFTEQNGRIGRISPTGTVTEFPLPTPNSVPSGITAGPDGNLWFTDQNNNSIGRITPTGTLTQFTVPTPYSEPNGITEGPDGNLWFTDLYGSDRGIGRISPTGAVTLFPLPTSFGVPYEITAGPDGNLWFTDFNFNDGIGRIGRISPTGSFKQFPLANNPSGITAGPDGNLWFTKVSDNSIGRITPTGAVTEFTVPTPNSWPIGITVGPDGNLWFTEYKSNKIGRVTLP